MTFAVRLCLYAVCAIAGILAWQWSNAQDASRDLTRLALQQFHNDADVPASLQQASLTQNWWPLLGLALLLLLGIVMFWDDVERWWTQEEK
jgi:tryptophan-rich sensory protein